MDQLQYECPYCNGTIAVDLESVGGQVVCPHCERPVRIDPPAARLIDAHAPGDAPQGRSPDAETTVKRVRPVMFRARPFTFLLLALMIVAGLVLLAAPTLLTTRLNSSIDGNLIRIVGAAVAAGGALGLLVWYISNMATTMEVTTKRTRLVHGIFSKYSSEVQHDDVRNIQVRQSFLQRLIGVGDIAISSSGQDDLEIVVKGVPGPESIADEIRRRQ